MSFADSPEIEREAEHELRIVMKKDTKSAASPPAGGDRYCYLDETGNTGLNHFDEAQEVFMQGCTVAISDLDESLKLSMAEIQNILGVSELHANVLGTGKLNQVSEVLRKAMTENDVAFVFTIIDKKYYVKLMMFHLIFDPGINPAVNSFSIWNRHLRLSLSFNFLLLMDDSDCSNFWTSVKDSDEGLFISVLKTVLLKVPSSGLDARSKELISDALSFTIENPTEIFNSMTFDGMTSSNLSAFTMMLNTLNHSPVGSGIRIKKLVHDEQKQFARFLKKSFSIFSKIMIPTTSSLLISEPVKVDIIEQAELTLIPSSTSFGIQLTDAALWIFKRYLSGQLHGLSDDLLREVLNRTYWDGISSYHHERGLLEGLEELGKKTFSQRQIRDGIELQKKMESGRWKSKK